MRGIEDVKLQNTLYGFGISDADLEKFAALQEKACLLNTYHANVRLSEKPIFTERDKAKANPYGVYIESNQTLVIKPFTTRVALNSVTLGNNALSINFDLDSITTAQVEALKTFLEKNQLLIRHFVSTAFSINFKNVVQAEKELLQEVHSGFGPKFSRWLENVFSYCNGTQTSMLNSIQTIKDLLANSKLNGITTKEVPTDYNLKFGNLNQIVLVVEIGDIRWGISNIGSAKWNGPEREVAFDRSNRLLRFMVAKNTEPEYNWLDPNRIYFRKTETQNIHHHNTLKAENIGNLVFFEDGASFLEDPNMIRTYLKPGFVDKTSLNETYSKALRDKKIKTIQQQKTTTQHDALVKAVKALDKTSHVSLNDMKIYKNRIEYQTETLSSSYIDAKSLMINILQVYKDLNDITFDLVFTNWLQYTSGVKASMLIGRVNVAVEYRITTSSTALSYVNGYRINRGEVTDVLRQAMCFRTNEDYEAFLKQVSTCSLAIHNILAQGLNLEIRDPFLGSNYVVLLELERKNNRNFVKVKDTLYPVASISALASFVKPWRDVTDLVRHLVKSDKILRGLDSLDKLRELLKTGEDVGAKALEKSKELLRHAEKTLKLTETTERIRNVDITGYKVVGVSGKEYFVDSNDHSSGAHGAHYPVYRLPEGTPICIVEKGNAVRTQAGKDALVNRLFALANDSYVADKITTL